MGGRFLDKRFTIQDGFSKGQGDDSPAVYFDGDTLKVTRGAAVEGDLTATAATLNAVTLKAGNQLTAVWRTTYTWNMGAIAGVYGSTNSVINVDVSMSGVAIGDTIIATCVGSIDLMVNFAAACYSAANVNLRAWYTGSTGALTPGNVPFKLTAIKI